MLRVNKHHLCPICEKPDWCSIGPDSSFAICMRMESDHPTKNGGWYHRLGENGTQYHAPMILTQSQNHNNRAAPEILDRIYREFLSILSLNPPHKANLKKRGLTTEQIKRHGYKTLPEKGRIEIAKRLIDGFGLETMSTIPGFMTPDNGNGAYPTFAGMPGILIPVKDLQERTIGLQIRLDDYEEDSSRYRWLSSAGRPNGTGSGVPAHIAFPQEKKGNQIWITEGPIKANISADIQGEIFIGVAGVSNWDAGKVLDILAQLQASIVIIAYDADLEQKTEVRQHRDNLAQACKNTGYQVLIATWPLEQGKGIDDLLITGQTPQIIPWQAEAAASNKKGPLKEAMEVSVQVLCNVQDDIGVAFEEKALNAWEILQDKDPAAWVRTKRALKKTGVSLSDLTQAIKKNKQENLEIEENLKKAQATQLFKIQSYTFAVIFEDSSLEGMKIPQDWTVTEQGIAQIKVKPNGEFLSEHVSYYPVIITATSRDIDEGGELVTLKYKKEGKIHDLTVNRKVISELRSITEMSEKGFPVNSVNAKKFIRYLEDFEALNMDYLKKSSITHGFGHRYDSKGNPFFYLPEKTYGTNELISFHGRGPGDYEFFKSLHSKGNLTDWIQIIKTYCLAHQRVMFALYAGFAVPLLQFFGCTQSFVIHSYGNRSCGKTTQNQIVASIYGNPARLLLQWKHITEVGAEQVAGLLNGLPIFLEDSQNVEDEKKLSDMIYLFANGTGKARGYKTGGLQKILFWLAIPFSTGEKHFFELIKKGGGEARSLSFYGSPFGAENDQKIGDMTKEIKRLVHQTYGVAALPYLNYIYSLAPEKLKTYYHDCYKFINAQITNAGEIHRHIDYFAVILTAGILAEEAFHFESDPFEVCKTILALFQEEKPSDAVSQAIEDTISWINSNDNLYDISGKIYEESQEGGYGQRHGVKNPGEYIAVFPHILKDFLIKQGYSPSVILKGWKDKGWIQCDGKNFTYPVGFRGKYARMIRVFWKIYSQV